MKHTPGPWQATKWANGFEICAPNEHYTIAKLSECNNAENNSRLIAAAPDTLEALKYAVTWLENVRLSENPPIASLVNAMPSEDKGLDSLRAAIRKATGE